MYENDNPDFESAEQFILSRLKEELSPTLSYHRLHHTFDVLHAAKNIADAEKISEEERKLLNMAVLFHDAGFIYVYKDHEEKGCEMANRYLPDFGFSADQINIICGMIMATKIPQIPTNKLERIICDADLDYLGRNDVYPIAQTLYEELKVYSDPGDEKQWYALQIDFLKSHHYQTAYAINLREPKKQQYLQELVKRLE